MHSQPLHFTTILMKCLQSFNLPNFALPNFYLDHVQTTVDRGKFAGWKWKPSKDMPAEFYFQCQKE